MGLFCTFSLTRLYNRLPFFSFRVKIRIQNHSFETFVSLTKESLSHLSTAPRFYLLGATIRGFRLSAPPPAMFPPRLRRSIFHGRFGSFHNRICMLSVSCLACPAITHFEKFGLSSVSLELWGSVSKCARVIPQKRRGQNDCSSMTLPSLSTARQWVMLRASEEIVTPHFVTVRPSAS